MYVCACVYNVCLYVLWVQGFCQAMVVSTTAKTERARTESTASPS